LLILGGGVAGLATAFYARRAGLSPLVFEGGAVPGGNARTLEHRGFRYDTGAHRLHDKDPDATRDLRALLGSDLRSVAAPSQIFRDGRFIDFPLAPLSVVSALGLARTARAAWDLAASHMSAAPEGPDTFESTVVRRYGRTIASLFVLEYSEKLWGVPARTLSPEVSGKRLQGLTLRALAGEALGRRDARHLDGAFLYPKHGIGQIADVLAGAAGQGAVHTNTRITRIGWAGDLVQEIEVDGRPRRAGDALVTTLPVSVTIKLMDPLPPIEVQEAASRLRFRDVRLVTILLSRPSVTGNATVYFPEARFPFTRVTEPRNRSRELAPPGCTSLVAEVPCWAHDRFSPEQDEALMANCVARLEEIGWLRSNDVIDIVPHRLRHAYPVLSVGEESALEPVHAWLGRFGNLRSAGRAGRFAYTHIHDLMKEGRQVVGALAARASIPTGMRLPQAS
jgi:protoporphyrinogen oxidase